MSTPKSIRVIDPILTNVVQGFRHPTNVGMALFPTVPVQASGGQVIEFGREDFRLYNTVRAPGDNVPSIQFGHVGKPFALENHALDAKVPREHQRDANAVPGIDLLTRASNRVLNVMHLGLEKQQADLARDAANYASSNKVTLSGTDQFSDLDDSDPAGVIQDAVNAIQAQAATDPNVIVLGRAVFNVLKHHPALTDKIKHTQVGVVTTDLLASFFDVPQVLVGKAKYLDDAGSFVDVWGKDIIVAYAPELPDSMEQPSYGYTYTLEESSLLHPIAEQAEWDRESRSWMAGISYERAPVLSGISSGYLITDAVA